jgi:hypothetical protein
LRVNVCFRRRVCQIAVESMAEQDRLTRHAAQWRMEKANGNGNGNKNLLAGH